MPPGSHTLSICPVKRCVRTGVTGGSSSAMPGKRTEGCETVPKRGGPERGAGGERATRPAAHPSPSLNPVSNLSFPSFYSFYHLDLNTQFKHPSSLHLRQQRTCPRLHIFLRTRLWPRLRGRSSLGAPPGGWFSTWPNRGSNLN